MRWPFLILALLLLCCGGCWASVDMNRLALVSGAALDRGEHASYRLTAQFVDPTGMVRNEERPNPYYTRWMEGSSILSCVTNLNRNNPRKPYWAHMKTLLIHEDLATEENVFDLLDFFHRDNEVRNDISIAMVSDRTAATYLEERLKPPLVESLILQEINEGAYEYTGKSPYTTLLDLLYIKYGPVHDMLLEKVQEKEGGIVYSGAVVLKKGKKVGEVQTPHIRGFHWLKNRMRRGEYTIPLENGKVSILVKGGETSMRITSLHPLTIAVEGTVDGYINEMLSPQDFSTVGSIQSLEKKCAALVADEIRASLKMSQELHADYCQVGNLVAQQYPDYWKKVKDSWSDHEWPQARFTVDISADIPHAVNQIPKGRTTE
jgi:Ger(x)C family germination protein